MFRALAGVPAADCGEAYPLLEAEVTAELTRRLRPGIRLMPDGERRLEMAAARLIAARLLRPDGVSGAVRAADVSFTISDGRAAESEYLAGVSDLLDDRDFVFSRTRRPSPEGGGGA